MLTDKQKDLIQTSYRKFTAREGFKPRYGQRVMIAEIAKYLGGISENSEGLRTSDPKVCVIEAGTGTGKTLAYSISVLPLALEEGRKVIVSTATTALQDQVMSKDLPELAKYSGLDFNYALAKGRGRYLCLSKLDQQLDSANSDSTALPLFMTQDEPLEVNRSLLETLLSAYASGKWDGDRDSWEDMLEGDFWRTVSTDNQQCTKRRCSYFNSCPYYETRKTWDDADLVVVNHDLLLSDLALGGGVLLPPLDQSILVLDEAHHLSEKALNHFTVNANLKGSEAWLKQVTKAMAELSPYLSQGDPLHKNIEQISLTGGQLHEWLTRIYDTLFHSVSWSADESGNVQRYRFVQGQVPDELKEMFNELKMLFSSLCRLLDEIRNEINRAVDEKSDCGLSREEAEQWFPVLGGICDRAEQNHALWMFYGKTDKPDTHPNARWLVLKEYDNAADISLYGSPLSAGGLLHDALWSKAYAAVLTSATLTALGRFDRFREKAGLPKESVYHRVQSPFDFPNVADLIIPPMKSSAGDPLEHTAEISENLHDWIGDDKAVLVLFSSRKQMNDVLYQVPSELRKDIMTQDEYSKQELVSKHKSLIDEESRSVLFGLASLAEGIDLPGKYLTHVVIAKVPFSVPNDPLEESVSEWLEAQGRNPFMEVTVPDASLKLIQACGRLIRTESDAGRITILDNRLLTRRYGRTLIDSLPPYRRHFAQGY